jgi:site-specific recombinase XerD
MSIENLMARYELTARAEGKSSKTVDHVKLSVKLFTSSIGGIQDVSKVKADDLRHFILDLEQRPKWAGTSHEKEDKISRTALNTYVRGVKTFWAWLSREGIIKENPLASVRTPKLPKLLPKIISEKEMVVVFDSVAQKPRETALLLLLLDSDITLSEVAELNDSYVDTADGTARVFREKTQKECYAYFSPPTGAAIEAYRFVRPEPVSAPRLFLTEDGRPLTARRIQKILERIGQGAKLNQRLSPHKLRHSFATWSLKYGSNLEYIRIMLGHSDIRTTSKAYLHMANADIAEASRITSPVVNLGIRKDTGWSAKPSVLQNGTLTPIRIPGRKKSGRGNGDTVIVIQNQSPGPPPPHPADGIMPVTYIKKPKTRKHK